MRLPGTRVFDLRSSEGDAAWRIMAHVPPGPAPEAGWPLLVMTDGNAVMGLAVDTLRIYAPHPGSTDTGAGVIVAVGYPVEEPYDPLRRSFDLSPPPGRTYPPFTAGGPEVRTGGADPFLRFIETEVLPFVEGLAPIDPARRTLFGHSFGGLFALYAMFRGAAFSRFVASSPTIYWEEGALLRFEEAFRARRREGDLVLHVSAGEYEAETLAPFQYGREDTQARLEALRLARTAALAEETAARLGALPGVTAVFETYARETHMSMIPLAVARGLRVAFETPRSAAAPADRGPNRNDAFTEADNSASR